MTDNSTKERIRELEALGLPASLVAKTLGLSLGQVTHRLSQHQFYHVPNSPAWRKARVARIRENIAGYPSTPYCFPERQP